MTLRQPVKISGWSFNAETVKMKVSPADSGKGIIFNNQIKVCVDNAQVMANCTSLKQADKEVMMVEHFLAACYGLGLTHLSVQIDGGVLPFGDGSASPFVCAFCRAGLSNSDVETQNLVSLREPVTIKKGKSFILAVPAAKLRINCFIDYSFVGRQFFSAVITKKLFQEEIAPARTFGRVADSRQPSALSHLEHRLGFTLQRVQDWVFPKRLRFRNEPCRHKVLDLLGDLALLGRPLQAEIFAFNPGHRLNLALVRRIREMGE